MHLPIQRDEDLCIDCDDLGRTQNKATTRQPGILCGWSGRVEQFTTGHSFGTYIINVHSLTHSHSTSEMTYIVSGGALNSTHSLTHSFTYSFIHNSNYYYCYYNYDYKNNHRYKSHVNIMKPLQKHYYSIYAYIKNCTNEHIGWHKKLFSERLCDIDGLLNPQQHSNVQSTFLIGSWRHGSVVRTSVFNRRTFPANFP